MLALISTIIIALHSPVQAAIPTRSTKIVTNSSRLLPQDHPIILAIDRDQATIVSAWLKRRNSAVQQINHRVRETLLERAATHASEKTFRLLLDHLSTHEKVAPAKYARDQRGTPLLLTMAAIASPEKPESKRLVKMIDHYLELHPDQVNWKDQAYIGDGRTALHQAAANGNVELLELLLSHGAQIDSFNSIGETPLHYAARFGSLKAVKILINEGAWIDQRTKHTRATPLLIASESGHESIIRELLENGAKKDAKDTFGKTAPERYREYVANYYAQNKRKSSN
jgi:hypothetical protein